MKLYRTTEGVVVEDADGAVLHRGADWDPFLNGPIPTGGEQIQFDPVHASLLAPIGTQEVWAAGVTYYRSRDARMEESKEAGGGDFYSRVYNAERPEIFFKATPHRVSGPGAPIRIRKDSNWNVPEPELALAINREGKIVGYTICNDVSSRDIEGQNPLYLPQAKTYDGCCGLGPVVLMTNDPLPKETEIQMEIIRAGALAWSGATTLAQLKRSPESLVEWLFRESSFPTGCYLSTGTGIIPPDSFTLARGDDVNITIPPLGTLSNPVA